METVEFEYESCAYVHSIDLAVKYALSYHRNLLKEQDLYLLESVYLNGLSVQSKRIFTRLLSRKNKWLKASSTLKYIVLKQGKSSVQPENIVKNALDELAQSKFIILFSDLKNDHISIEERDKNIWLAITSLLTYSQIKDLYKYVIGTKMKNHIGMNKDEFLDTFKKEIDSQRNFFGSSLKDVFHKKLSNFFLEMSKDGSSNGKSNQIKMSPFKLNDNILILFRRLQRFYQMTSNISSSSLGGNSSVNLLNEPVEYYLPLMTKFKLITFVDYDCDVPVTTSSCLFRDRAQFDEFEFSLEIKNILEKVESLLSRTKTQLKANPDNSNKDIVNNNKAQKGKVVDNDTFVKDIFQNYQTLFEGANDYLKKAITSIFSNHIPSYNKLNVAEFYAQYDYCKIPVKAQTIQSLSMTLQRIKYKLLAISLLITVVTCTSNSSHDSTRENINQTAISARNERNLLSESSSDESSDNSDSDSDIESRTDSDIQNSDSSMNILVEEKQNDSISEEIRSKQNPLVDERDYLARFESRYNLLSIIQEMASTYERDLLFPIQEDQYISLNTEYFEKNYAIAILLYEFLLFDEPNGSKNNQKSSDNPLNKNTIELNYSSELIRFPIAEDCSLRNSRYHEHRRGKFYLRCCIDWQHLRLSSYALHTAEVALRYDHQKIMLSDEIALQDRLLALEQKIQQQQRKPTRNAQTNGDGELLPASFESSLESEKYRIIKEIIGKDTTSSLNSKETSEHLSFQEQFILIILYYKELYQKDVSTAKDFLICTLLELSEFLLQILHESDDKRSSSKATNQLTTTTTNTNHLRSTNNNANDNHKNIISIDDDIDENQFSLEETKVWICSKCTYKNYFQEDTSSSSVASQFDGKRRVSLRQYYNSCNMCNHVQRVQPNQCTSSGQGSAEKKNHSLPVIEINLLSQEEDENDLTSTTKAMDDSKPSEDFTNKASEQNILSIQEDSSNKSMKSSAYPSCCYRIAMEFWQKYLTQQQYQQQPPAQIQPQQSQYVVGSQELLQKVNVNKPSQFLLWQDFAMQKDTQNHSYTLIGKCLEILQRIDSQSNNSTSTMSSKQKLFAEIYQIDQSLQQAFQSEQSQNTIISEGDSQLASRYRLKCFILSGKRCGEVGQRIGKSKFVGIRSDEYISVEDYVMEKLLQFDPDDQEKIDNNVEENQSNAERTEKTKKKTKQKQKETSQIQDKSDDNHPICIDISSDHEDALTENIQEKKTTKKRRRAGQQQNQKQKQTQKDTDIDSQLVASTKSTDTQRIDSYMKNFQQIPYTSIISTPGIDKSNPSPLVENLTNNIEDLGGWYGVHCEGAILRTLCGLLMFDVVFQSLGSSSTSPIFLTPYQDAPLDFGYPSYFQRRELAIITRVKEIARYSLFELLEYISGIYTKHYQRVCRVIRWSRYSMVYLQLAAVCVGPRALAVLCYLHALSERQLRSGAPDLFLVRVSERRTPTNGEIPAIKILNIREILGKEWPSNDSRNNRANDDDDNENLLLPIIRPQKRQRRGKSDQQPDGLFNEEVEEIVEESNQHSIGSEKEVLGEVGQLPSTQPLRSTVNEFDEEAEQMQNVNEETSEIQSSMKFTDLPSLLPHLRPNLECAADSTQVEYIFESMCVEVKGPSDHLAYKQLLWLQLLTLVSDDTTTISNTPGNQYPHSFSSFVCHVKEQ